MKTIPNKSQVEMPFIEPLFYIPVIKLRQSDGSILVKAGKPELLEPEVTVSVFHKETRISKRHIQTLCEQGLIRHRRLSPKPRSKILIPQSEVTRYKKLEGEI